MGGGLHGWGFLWGEFLRRGFLRGKFLGRLRLRWRLNPGQLISVVRPEVLKIEGYYRLSFF
jgi:hypothetical protein